MDNTKLINIVAELEWCQGFISMDKKNKSAHDKLKTQIGKLKGEIKYVQR